MTVYIYNVQKNDEQFKSTRLVKMALGVAKGMNYLSEVGYVHRVSETVATGQWQQHVLTVHRHKLYCVLYII